MMKVRDLMRSRPRKLRCISPSASLAAAGQEFLDADISSLLVCEGDDVVGIFTKNDLVRHAVKSPDGFSKLTVADGMTTKLFTTTPDADLEDVVTETLRRGFHHLPVLEGGEAVEMLTPIDILLYQTAELREETEDLIRYIRGGY